MSQNVTAEEHSYIIWIEWYNLYISYMANSVSGQDESNPVLWLATRVGKMELSCPLGTTRRVPQQKFPWKTYDNFLIDLVCSVKMAWFWPLFFFLACLWTSTLPPSINTQKRKELGQYSAILTSLLVNYPYIFTCKNLLPACQSAIWKSSPSKRSSVKPLLRDTWPLTARSTVGWSPTTPWSAYLFSSPSLEKGTYLWSSLRISRIPSALFSLW